MDAQLFIRLASFCLIIFAAGHTVGHVMRTKTKDSKAQEVLKQMSYNKFNMFGKMRSFDENYVGMSLNLIFTLLTLAITLFILSYYVYTNTQMVRSVLIPISICVLGFAITSFRYFFTVPGVTCTVAFVLIVFSIFYMR
jgi:hypothetical protein